MIFKRINVNLWGIALSGGILVLGLIASHFWLSKTHGAYLVKQRPVLAVVMLCLLASLTVMSLLARWVRWHFLSRRFGIMIRTRDSFRVYFGTLVGFATPFYLGELARGFLLSRRYPEILGVTFWIWVIERMSDVGSLALFWLIFNRHAVWAIFLSIVVLGIPVIIHLTRSNAKMSLRFEPNQIAICFALPLLSLFAWLCPIVGLALTIAAFTGQYHIGTAGTGFAEGSLLGGIVGIPLGVGVTGSMAILSLAREGVPPDVATASIVILRAGTAWFALGLGVYSLILFRRTLYPVFHRAETKHFDDIAHEYPMQIASDFRTRLLGRKISIMHSCLQTIKSPQALRGLDLGCGHGWYLCEMSRLGYQMSGIDAASSQINEGRLYAQKRGVDASLNVADATSLPFESNSFDFVYCINMLHHLASGEMQKKAVEEVVRVLKPEGLFFLHEMNTFNPLFRFYLSYIFPLARSIDEGNERWLPATQLPAVKGGRWEKSITYFTFLPDFIPSFVGEKLVHLEHRLEQSRINHYSIHYMARMIKDATTSPLDPANETLQ